MAKGYLYDNGDELITREDVNEVPDSSSAHAGDVLGLDTNKKPKWTTPESGLPDTSEASAGDVLSLDEDKEPVWSTPSGGENVCYARVSETLDGATISFYPASDSDTPLTFEELKNKIWRVSYTPYSCSDFIFIDREEDGSPYQYVNGSVIGLGSTKMVVFDVEVETPISDNATSFAATRHYITYDT